MRSRNVSSDRRSTTSSRASWAFLLVSAALPLLLAGGVLASAAPVASGSHDATSLTPSARVLTPTSCTGGTTSAVTSSNWAGYAVETCLSTPTTDAVSFVQGSWVEPTVKCTSGETAYAAFWVGIDGYSSSSVEQLGTDSDCSSGSPSYYAWYEMYPAAPVTLSLTISPGNPITASVSYTSSHFVLKLTDQTTGKSFSVTKSYKPAKRSSAEWVAEAPSSSSGVLPLADFGTVDFTNCTATLEGTTGPISDSSWENAQMTMASGSTTKASTSSLGSSGASFSSTWHHS